MKYIKQLDQTGKALLHIDLEGAELDQFKFDYTPLLDYRISTYRSISASGDVLGWNTLYRAPQEFLHSRPAEEQKKFATLLTMMHYEIREKMYTESIETFNKNLVPLERTLSAWLAEFDQEVDLVPNLITWTERNVPIYIDKNAGSRPQDTEAMTFYLPMTIKLTAFVIVCKLLSPIFGIFIEICKKQSHLGNNLKELHCHAILKDLVEKRFPDLLFKLKHYIATNVKSQLKEAAYPQLYNGYTMASIGDMVYAHLAVRKFVVVDLYREGGSLLKYVASNIRENVKTHYQGVGIRESAAELQLPNEDSSLAENDNASYLEAESVCSSKTADYGVLVSAAASRAYSIFITEHDFDPQVIEQMYAYYSLQHIPQTSINTFLLSLMFGTALGGAQSVEMLNGPTFTKLICALQYHFATAGYLELVHPLTFIDTGKVRLVTIGNDAHLKATWNNSFEYKTCNDRYQWQIGDLRWDTRLKEIVELVTSHEYSYNTAPVIWDTINEENRNGELYSPHPDLSRQICSIIMQL